MRKLALFLSLILCLGLFTALPAAARITVEREAFEEGENELTANVDAVEMFKNCGFELEQEMNASSTPWGVSSYEAGVLTRSRDAHTGSWAMEVSKSANNSTCLRQEVSVTAGVEYELSAWVKTSNPSSGHIYIECMFTDNNGVAADADRPRVTFQNPSDTSNPTSLTKDKWTQKGVRFKAPEGPTKAVIYFYLNGIGHVLWDDVSFLCPKDSLPAIEGLSEKKNPVLTENSSSFGNVYEITAAEGNFEKYYVGESINKSANPGGHYAVVSGDYDHTTGSGKSLRMERNSSDTNMEANLYFRNENLVPGATYQLSTHILVPEEGTSALFSYIIDFFGSSSTDSADQVKNHFRVTHYPWWREVTFDFTVPYINNKSKVTTSVELRLSTYNVHYYIDDITLYMVEKPSPATLKTDELFYYSEWETGTFSATADASFASELNNGGKVVYTFLGQDKTTPLETKTVYFKNGEADYVFQTSLMAEMGKEYFVSAKVYSAAGSIIQEETHSVYRFNRPTYMGADGIFRKNDKEYNLIMGSNVTTELLEADPRKGGVQIVRLVSDGTSLQSRMDKAHEMGLLCLVGLYSDGISAGNESAIANTINMVNTYKDHPALFGWKVQDEPYQKNNSSEELARAYVTIRNLDPHHPVYLVDSNPGGYEYLFRHADVVDIDCYDGNHADSGRIFTEKLEVAKAASKGRKPFTLLQQAFQYQGYRPTIDEMRNFAYQAYFAGVSGVGYYALGYDGSDGITTPYMYMDDWKELCERFAPWEQGFLLDCFVHEKYPMLKSYTDNNAMWRTYLVGDKIYVIAFNRQRNASSSVSIPLTNAAGTSMMGGFVATRKAGTGDAPAPIFGNGTLSLTLGGITARKKVMLTEKIGGLAAEIWELTPSLLSADGTFSTVTTETARPFLTSFGVNATAGKDYAIVPETDATATGDSSNLVFKVTSANIRDTLKFPIAVTDGQYTVDDTLKVTFRLFIKSNDETVDTSKNITLNYSNGSEYSANNIRVSVPFSDNTVNKWLDCEVLMSAFPDDSYYLNFLKCTGYDYYVDDMTVQVVDSSYISDLKPIAAPSAKSHTLTGLTKPAWIALYYGTRGTAFAKTDVIRPVIYFSPEATGDKALAVAAIYKSNSGVRTLVDIKLAELSRTTVTSTGTAYGGPLTLTQVGLLPDTFNIAAASGAGEYEAEYFLWSYDGLEPITNVASFTIQ